MVFIRSCMSHSAVQDRSDSGISYLSLPSARQACATIPSFEKCIFLKKKQKQKTPPREKQRVLVTINTECILHFLL